MFNSLYVVSAHSLQKKDARVIFGIFSEKAARRVICLVNSAVAKSLIALYEN